MVQGLLVETYSPPTTSLKFLEENAALYRKLGDRATLHFTLARESRVLWFSGDLDLAATKLREAARESEAIGEPPGEQYLLFKGNLALSQADLEGVRNAVHLLETSPRKQEDYLDLEAAAFIEEDRLPEARETLEKLRSWYEVNGRENSVLGVQRALCALFCEEGRPREALDCHVKRSPSAGGPAATIPVKLTNLSLAYCRYLAGDLEGAEEAALAARAKAQSSGYYWGRVFANAYVMRVRAARGETNKAIASLRADLADAERRKEKALAFMVAFALGEVELRAGRPEGRARLLRLEQEAKSKEFFLDARLVREALDAKPVTPTPAK